MKSALRMLLVAALSLASDIAVAPSADAAAINVMGTVVCTGGEKVVGVWVHAEGGGGGFADWSRMGGAAHVAKYQRAISGDGRVKLSVGCGGETNSWRTTNRTPWTTGPVSTTRSLNTLCTESERTCAWPPDSSTATMWTTNNFAYGHCTWYAANRMYDHIGWYPGWSGDARLWATRAREARWVVRPEPMARAIVVMPPSYVGNSLGHVAFVEWVDYSSAFATGARITISEMNAPTWNKRTQRTLDHHASFQYLLLP